MKIEDIEIGMKVRLLGKHGYGDYYDDIEEFYHDYSNNNYRDRISIETLKKQGYGYVVRVANNGDVFVDECEDGIGWCFLHSDIEPYEEVNITQEKTPKEWLLTPLAVSSTRDEEYVTLGDRCLHDIADGEVFANIDSDYDDNLNDICNDSTCCDIVKITYKDKVVWERKEEYFTLVEAINFNKEVKHKDWDKFYGVNDVLINLAEEQNDFILKALSEKVWEVR